MNLDSGALHIVQRLQDAGYRALLAGGCVRDWLRCQQPHDWDIATNAAPEQVMALFAHTRPVGVHFGIVVVIWQGRPYEVARFRRDGAYVDGRRPQQVCAADVAADARRRDFTINGMYLDPLSEELIDLVGGRADLAAGVVRAIGSADERFAEDHLRMLRAVRFAAQLDFQLESATRAAILRQAPRVTRVSCERVRDELTRILLDGGAVRGLRLLRETGLLAVTLPAVAALQGVEQPPQFHPEGDVWTHTLLVLEKLGPADAALAWAALLHDIGKPSTKQVTDRIRFNRHEVLGAQMARTICRELRMSNQLAERVETLVAQHMRLRQAPEMRPGKLKRLLRQPWFPQLLQLHRADCLGSHGDLSLYEFCRQQLQAREPEELRPPRLLSGNDLQALGFVPGPLFGEILEMLEEQQLEGRMRTPAEARRYVLSRYGDQRCRGC